MFESGAGSVLPDVLAVFTFLAAFDFAGLPEEALRSTRGVAPVRSRLIVAATASMWLYSSVAMLQRRSSNGRYCFFPRKLKD